MTKRTETLPPNSTIGIFGGGQLGRMLCFAAHQLGYKTVIFSNLDNSPASFVCSQTIVGDYLDKNKLKEFTNKIDIATFEFENIPTQAVDFVGQTKSVFPNSNVLKITQNRLKEKNFVNNLNIKTTKYYPINCLEDLTNGLKNFNYEAILKTATMGYDGKGQKFLNRDSNLAEIWNDLYAKQGQQLILEQFSHFKQEISVIAARSVNGEIKCYQPLKNIHKDGILFQSHYPANLKAKTIKNAISITKKIIVALDLIGLLTVEFFVLENGDLLLNEMAPRPHNSGHFSLDGCYTSQFEQLVRAITGLPLGDCSFHHYGYMQNLIGNGVLELKDYLKNPKAKLYLYCKDSVIEGRKMGHINYLQQNQAKLLKNHI